MKKLVVEAVAFKDVKVGELFSIAGYEYWGRFPDFPGIGERVYLRTDKPCPPHEVNMTVYRLRIEEVTE